MHEVLNMELILIQTPGYTGIKNNKLEDKATKEISEENEDIVFRKTERNQQKTPGLTNVD